MNKNILQILAGIIFFIWAKWFASIGLQSNLYGMAIGVAVTLLIKFGYFLYNERNFLSLYFNSLIQKRNSEIRLSIAYLFKIECRGKYLLVKKEKLIHPYWNLQNRANPIRQEESN